MPVVDGGIVLHAGIAAEVRALADHAQQIARLERLARLAAPDVFRLPVAVLLDGAHEFIGHAHRIVGVLEKYAAVSRSVETRIVARLDQRPGFLLFFDFALDELFDVGVIDVQNNHLRRAPGLAAGFDYARRRIGGFHERYRSRRGAAAGQLFFGRTNLGKIDAGARAPFEDHPLFAIPIEDRIHGVFDRKDETRRALRLFFDAAVKPDRAVKTGFLMEQDMGQFVGKRLGVVLTGKIAVFSAPSGDGIDDPADHLAHALLALRRAERTAKVFGHHHLRGHQRPGFGNLDIVLFEDDLALLIGDGSVAQIPFDLVVGAHPRATKVTRYFETAFHSCRSLLRGAEFGRLRSTCRHLSYSFPYLETPIYGVIQPGMH